MKTFLMTGHVVSCTNPNECQCALRINLVAGTSTMIAGGVMAGIGFYNSLAVLSDSPHALGDSAGYFLAAGILFRLGSAQLSDKARRITQRLLAALLGGSVIWILHEAYGRFFLEEYPMNPLWAMCASAFATGVHGSSWWLLKKMRETSGLSTGLIAHAKSDFFHALSVFTLAGITSLGTYVLHWPLPLKGIDMSFTFLLTIYMSVLTVYVWQGKHLHLAPIRTAKRILRFLSGKPASAHAHHHHEGGECGDHHH